jgi:hypothetical protein
MDPNTAWSAEGRAALEAVAASVAVLGSFGGAGAGAGAGSSDSSDPYDVPDPLRDLVDGCLDGLAEVARLEARTAALKATLAADYLRAATTLAAPASSPGEATAQELAVVAELACVLTVSERAAAGFLAESRSLATGLPLTLAALKSGTISWQHARIIVDETSDLDPAAAAGLEAHFLDPAAPDPARGCPAGDLVPHRFRAKARTWRERHHPISSKNATPKAPGTGGSSSSRTGTAWPGSPPTSRQQPPPGSGNG